MPGLDEMPEGCRFCTRCPYVEERCRKVDPGMRERNGHRVRCYRWEESGGEDAGKAGGMK